MNQRHEQDSALPGSQTASAIMAASLRKTILDGQHHAGDRLPTERELAEQHQVSRHVVREALKRLEATGLVQIRHGSGCYISNLQFTGGMELLEDMLLSGGHLDTDLITEIVDFVSNMGREAIRLSAIHRSEDHVRKLREVIEAHANSVDDIVKNSETSFKFSRFSLTPPITGSTAWLLIPWAGFSRACAVKSRFPSRI